MEKSKLKLTVGQTVFVRKINNAYGRITDKSNLDDIIIETTVSKIGKKWFAVEGSGLSNYRFSIEDGYNDGKGYASDYIVYNSKSEIYDETEMKDLLQSIPIKIRENKLTLEQLRRINSIINEGNDGKDSV